MQSDPHLGTGVYDPATYWTARARRESGDPLENVCVFGASDVENRCADRVQARALRRVFARVGVRGARVLEYGCGIGRWAPRVTALGARWAGVDLCPDMCARARERWPDADVRELPDGRIPHGDGAFDVVYAVTVLHHNPHGEQERILGEMVRVLRPGGALVLLEDVGTTGGFNMFPRTRAGWRHLVEDRGFRLLDATGLRYWILRGALARLRRRAAGVAPAAGPLSTTGSTPARSPLRRAVDRLDAWLDPWLQPLVPAAARTAVVMAFRDVRAD